MTNPADPTDFAGISDDTEVAHAWALDYEDATPTERLMTPRRITVGAVAASLVAIAVAGGLAAYHLRPPSSLASAPTPTTTTPAPLPTITTVIMAQPPAPPPTPQETIEPTPEPSKPLTAADIAAADPGPTVEQDRQFLSFIRGDGLNVTNQALAVAKAHEFCRHLRKGVDVDTLNRQIAVDSGYGMDLALVFTMDAMSAYPGCRFGVG